MVRDMHVETIIGVRRGRKDKDTMSEALCALYMR